ncbi:cytochrome P450 9e2 [Anabrus simplex]|uniref:cytochrome P450 9e2 n=1 Tax=Anabrus simplex TaxID=316456 RepID=UPI0035A2AAA9
MGLLGLGWMEWPVWVALALAAIYKLGTWNYNYFTARGVKTMKTVPFFGSFAGTTFKKQSFASLIEDSCKNFKGERYVGLFQFLNPILMIKDPELIKRVTVKDFDHFVDHVQSISKNADPLMGRNLFFLRGEKWRDLRSTLSPAFTSSKMRNMFVFIDGCGQQLADYLQSEIDKEAPGKPFVVEMKDLFTRYTTDVIGTAAFGININSLKVKDNDFYRMGKQITSFSNIRMLKMVGFLIIPKILEFLGITFFTKEEHKFFTDLVEDTVTTRDREGIVRHDMIDLLMQARRGELKGDGEEEEQVSIGEGKAKKLNLSLEDIAAQALGFFFAGFDSASGMLSFASILLAMHEDVQSKVQQEVDEILGDDRKVTYDKLQKTKYLDMVLAETLRMYPPTPSVDRMCTKTFTIPASDKHPEYTLQPGDQIAVPIFGIHHDPEYFPDPKKFDPERFSDENKANINPYAYLPFGLGPRMCLGHRFVMLETKVALIHILSRFSLVVVEKTPLPLKLSAESFSLGVEGGFWIGVKPRENEPT